MADEIERLLALQGYSPAFDWVLGQIPSTAPRPRVTEALILDIFLERWGPSVDAGIVESSDRRRWRSRSVQIDGSDYAPPSSEKLPPLMRLLVDHAQETTAGLVARAARLHWGMVHADPFMDGNGAVARLLMNFLLAGAGLPWTTISGEERSVHFRVLERAHLDLDLKHLADFLGTAVQRATAERSVWERDGGRASRRKRRSKT